MNNFVAQFVAQNDLMGLLFHQVFPALWEQGWETYITGGSVRDMVWEALTGVPCESKDIDVLVRRCPDKDALTEALGRFGTPKEVGASFGVIKLHLPGGDEVDFTLPRRENKVGQGYKGFVVDTEPFLPPEQDLARRDFTINAMALEVKSSEDGTILFEVLDSFNGIVDLATQTLRHVGPAFAEDPLRVLRGMRFAAQFGLEAAPETISLCRQMLAECHTLTPERVWGEWKKWALRATSPSHGLRFLKATGWLGELYPELAVMDQVQQDPVHHPEGSVWEHTLHVVESMAALCHALNIEGDSRVALMFAALLHDVGKSETTVCKNGRWVSPGHAQAGVPLAERFLRRIYAPQKVIDHVLPLVREHMVHLSWGEPPTEKVVLRLADRLQPATVFEWSLVVHADYLGRPPKPGLLPEKAVQAVACADKIGCLHGKPQPLLRGRDLIPMGLKPGPIFGEILATVEERRREGLLSTREDALQWVQETYCAPTEEDVA